MTIFFFWQVQTLVINEAGVSHLAVHVSVRVNIFNIPWCNCNIFKMCGNCGRGYKGHMSGGILFAMLNQQTDTINLIIWSALCVTFIHNPLQGTLVHFGLMKTYYFNSHLSDQFHM